MRYIFRRPFKLGNRRSFGNYFPQWQIQGRIVVRLSYIRARSWTSKLQHFLHPQATLDSDRTILDFLTMSDSMPVYLNYFLRYPSPSYNHDEHPEASSSPKNLDLLPIVPDWLPSAVGSGSSLDRPGRRLPTPDHPTVWVKDLIGSSQADVFIPPADSEVLLPDSQLEYVLSLYINFTIANL